MQLREAIASPRTLIISFNFSIARVVKHTLDNFSNILFLRENLSFQYGPGLEAVGLRIINCSPPPSRIAMTKGR